MSSSTARRRGDRAPFQIGDGALSLDDFVALAEGRFDPVLAESARAAMKDSAEVVRRRHEDGTAIYGVTTSVGASVDTNVLAEDAAALSMNVVRMHAVGSGPVLGDVEAAGVLVARLLSLANGSSGIRPEIADQLVECLRRDVLPCIPERGSVGASGDLTPLSYVAAVLAGEREARVAGEDRVLPASDALRRAGIDPIALAPKEGLALMNGTAVSTALAALAWARARRLVRVGSRIAAAASLATAGNAGHFDPRLHAAKPHPGQQRTAAWILDELRDGDAGRPPQHLQDRYSIRCAPHVLGVLDDALTMTGTMLETELNGVSDNPIVSGDEILHGGNFYGGHVAFVCDSLKSAVANVACLLDRQILLLCNPAENGGLPRDLVGVDGAAAAAHNGFKAASIAASSLAAEALKATMPASAFSRSTELHNQDKVPMATIAARDLVAVVELTEQVLAIGLLAAAQALDLSPAEPGPRLAQLVASIREEVPRLREDRRMDVDQQAVLRRLHAGGFDD